MKVIEMAVMPNGTEIQLEDWSEHNTEKFPDLYGLQIGAYPTAKNTSKYRGIEGGKTFRLTISTSKCSGYTNKDVSMDFEELKNGKKQLENLASHFWNGKKDMWYLGMDVKYQGW